MHIAASTVDITPVRPVDLGGYGRGTPFTAISERLEANLVVLCSDPGSDPVVIISLDLLYPGRLLRAALESALPELEPNQIFLAASHTHQAPMTDDTKLAIGIPDSQYLDALAAKLASEVLRLISVDQTQSGLFFTSVVTASHSINRRLKRRFQISRREHGRWGSPSVKLARNVYAIAPNPGGATDETITILISRSALGKAQFVIWNYACHPVAFPERGSVAAHFPHYVREALRASLGVTDLPVLFLQGFSGNTRPSASVDDSTGLRSRIRCWLLGPRFVNMTWASYISWSRELGELVVAGCVRAVQLDDLGTAARRSKSPTSLFVEGAAEPDVTFHSIRVGLDFAIVGASAEVVAEFAPKVRAMAVSKQVMCVGCMDHPFGYAPTSRILREGGYEGGEYCSIFDLGSLTPGIEGEIERGFRSVL